MQSSPSKNAFPLRFRTVQGNAVSQKRCISLRSRLFTTQNSVSPVSPTLTWKLSFPFYKLEFYYPLSQFCLFLTWLRISEWLFVFQIVLHLDCASVSNSNWPLTQISYGPRLGLRSRSVWPRDFTNSVLAVSYKLVIIDVHFCEFVHVTSRTALKILATISCTHVWNAIWTNL